MTCRFCRKDLDCGPLVHYSVRSYAHTTCLVAAKGEAFLFTLPVGALATVAIFQVSEPTRNRILAMVETR